MPASAHPELLIDPNALQYRLGDPRSAHSRPHDPSDAPSEIAP
jgi:hypothetical protein